jgi:hypothetical protein
VEVFGHHPPLPSILLANVQSIDKKVDELRARISFQRDIRDCNIQKHGSLWIYCLCPYSQLGSQYISQTEIKGRTKAGMYVS